MPSTDDYRTRRLERRESRRERSDRLRRRLPEVLAFCKANSIDLREVPGGFQFRRAAVAMSWWPSSNKISIQSPDRPEAERFVAGPVPDRPKIMLALQWLSQQ